MLAVQAFVLEKGNNAGVLLTLVEKVVSHKPDAHSNLLGCLDQVFSAPQGIVHKQA